MNPWTVSAGAAPSPYTWRGGREVRRGAIALLAAVLVALVVFPASVVAAPPVGMADVRFRPDTVAVSVGGLFSAEVVVDASTEVEGAQVVIAYDPAYLEFVSAQTDRTADPSSQQ